MDSGCGCPSTPGGSPLAAQSEPRGPCQAVLRDSDTAQLHIMSREAAAATGRGRGLAPKADWRVVAPSGCLTRLKAPSPLARWRAQYGVSPWGTLALQRAPQRLCAQHVPSSRWRLIRRCCGGIQIFSTRGPTRSVRVRNCPGLDSGQLGRGEDNMSPMATY